jgi:hypothetical protein
MRRLSAFWPVALLAAALSVAGGCRRQPKAHVEATDEEAPTLSSIVHVADPRSAPQLLTGFHELEQNSWRWTMGKFSVILRPPGGAAQNGARLETKLSVPEPVIERLKTVSLTASIGDQALPAETYSKAGDYVYSRDVPASLLTGTSVVVNFALDKFLPPGQIDQRELGIVVITVGLEPK